MLQDLILNENPIKEMPRSLWNIPDLNSIDFRVINIPSKIIKDIHLRIHCSVISGVWKE